ncbi:MAG: CRISPR-associated endonuclease Cas1 [Chloroflexi bacterium]|nr:CRISPR-associated endonuclease Cas1 [Chloroflexota bacterium]
MQGLEGSGTAHYFNSFKHLLNDPSLYNGRTRRPPRDPVNALLSYGYTILLNQIMSAICTVGLDPYIGYLHTSQYGKPALALDLMEEFRPLIVDSTVIAIFNNNILHRKHFTEELGGAYRLSDYGRRTFLTKLESRFDETITHPTFNYKVTYRRSLEPASPPTCQNAANRNPSLPTLHHKIKLKIMDYEPLHLSPFIIHPS